MYFVDKGLVFFSECVNEVGIVYEFVNGLDIGICYVVVIC